MMRGSGALAACAVLVPEAVLAQEEPTNVIEFGASYITDIIGNVDGGEKKGFVWLGRADLTMSVDGSAFGWDGAELFVDVLAVQHPDFSGRYVGDAQTVSNVQGESSVRPIEAWIAGPLGGGVSAKVGMIDLNSEFDVQSVGKHFIGSSHGIGPDFSQSGANGPSIFPAGATAVMLHYEDEDWALRFGLFDAVAGSKRNPRRAAFRIPGDTGALLVGEVDRKLVGGGEVQLGAWHYTPRFERLDPARAGKGVSQGAYAMIEGPVARRAGRQLDAWLRLGVASSAVNEIGTYVGGGVAYGNDNARMGLAVAHARRGAPARRAAAASGDESDRAETAIELTYAYRLTPWLTLQPDFQYVINPGWDPGRRNAAVAGIRFSFAWPAD
jgi:porin